MSPGPEDLRSACADARPRVLVAEPQRGMRAVGSRGERNSPSFGLVLKAIVEPLLTRLPAMTLLRRSMRPLFALAVAATLLCLTPAPVQAQTTETYDVSGFTALDIGIRGTVSLSQGDSESLSITGPDDVLSDIDVSVDNGRLTIQYGPRNWIERFFTGEADAVDVDVTMSSIESLSVSGGAEVVGATPIEAGELRVGVSGAGEIELDITADRLRSEISGAGEMHLQGTAESHRIEISGAGTVRAADLETRESSIRVSGAGECEVYATSRLDVAVSGAGTVRYRGEPRISQSVSGAASVKAL